MYENKSIIDANGYMVEKVILFKDGEPQNYEIKEDQQAIPYVSTSQIVNDREVEYLKPQWTGTEWIETATEEELNEVYPPISLNSIKQDKINEFSNKCNYVITKEFYSDADGTMKNYDFELENQINMSTKAYQIQISRLAGQSIETISYYAKGETCHDYTADQFLQLAQEGEIWKTSNIQKYKDVLKPMIEVCNTVEEVNAITWDSVSV